MPACCRTSSIGRRIVWLGTGRVMSQIRMQASFRPWAIWRSAGVPIGSSSAAATAASGSGKRRHVANRQRPDDPLRGQLHVQSRPAVVECELHSVFMMSAHPLS